jgi:hypothetical protein
MGHQGLGHWLSPEIKMNRAAPYGAASMGGDVTPGSHWGKGAQAIIAT